MKLTRTLIFGISTMLASIATPRMAHAADINYQFIRMTYKLLDNTDLSSNRTAPLWMEMNFGWLSKDDIINMAMGDPARRPFVVGKIYQEYLRRPATAFDLNYWGTQHQNWTTEADLRAAVMATDEFYKLPCTNYIGSDAVENFVCNVGYATGHLEIALFIAQHKGEVPSGSVSRRQFAYQQLGGDDGGAYYCREQMFGMAFPGGSLYQGDLDSLFLACQTSAAKRDEEGAVNVLVHSSRFYQMAKYYTN